MVVFGKDWDTPDGTGIRDWIHVVDLAIGQIAALNKIATNDGIKVKLLYPLGPLINRFIQIYNLGTGQGYSVLEAVKAFEKVTRRNTRRFN